MPKVVITMPAYQAERTLERTVLAIPPGVADELILVDDASRDGTAELARTLGLTVHVHPDNRGYGGNQKSCYRLALDADADIVVLLHPDYQYEPKAVPLLDRADPRRRRGHDVRVPVRRDGRPAAAGGCRCTATSATG